MKTETRLSFLLLLAVAALSACSLFSPAQPAPAWQNLQAGDSLEEWVQRGGRARYEVVGGVIIGTTALATPNSFLCTKKTYGDFILELDFKVDPALNSGIQIRSSSFPEYGKGRVHGYQVEIDPSHRAWTGGIYDEARRGWLHPLDANPKARRAFRQGEWNRFRIEAIGPSMKTWINGVPAAHLVDDRTDRGFIALQVHSVGKDRTREGIQVKWRNIRILTEDLEKHATPSPLPPVDMYNRLTTNEKKAGWKLLFDGKTSRGWRGAGLGHFPRGGWAIGNGVLTVLESGGKESDHGGDIVTVDEYSRFDLCVDFRLTRGANSGIKYFVDTGLNKGKGPAIGLEYQLLDDENHPDAKKGSLEGSRTLASLYDLIKAENKHARPIGRWNHARILAKGKRVEHWLNGRKVLEYTRGSPGFRKLVAGSKYRKWPDFGELESGKILLQDHGDRVSFRNIKIRVLKK